MIYVENLRKEFKKTIKEPGLKGSLKSFIRPKKEIVVALIVMTIGVLIRNRGIKAYESAGS